MASTIKATCLTPKAGWKTCFVGQYGNFTIKDPVGKETHLNGQMTLGENLTDNGGLKKAFETWQARYKSDPSGKTIKNQRLPGLRP
ncbi:hypothetical protein MVEG_01392 [Podila verticillata NRRL 6337]|nr:hypothetical protein MVEG_01392 [Podila verticillata NRRL 6337]